MTSDPSVASAIQGELEAIRTVAPAVADSGLAASVLRAARLMDAPDLRPAAATGLLREIREAMDALHGKARQAVPAGGKKVTRLDDLADRRARRLGLLD